MRVKFHHRLFATRRQRSASPSGHHVNSQHLRILGSLISGGSDDAGLTEARVSKFLQEGAALSCSSNSGKPVGFVPGLLFGQSLSKDEFSNKDRALQLHDSSQLGKDRISIKAEVEDAVYKCNIYGGVGERKSLNVRLLEHSVFGSQFISSLLSFLQHGITEIDSNYVT